MEWNEDVIGRLRELWAEGHSTAEIGRRLGVSKNAIVGKAHRLELPARPSPIKREGGEQSAERRAAPRRVEGPTLPPLASSGETPEPEQTIEPEISPVVAAVAPPVLAPVVAVVPMPLPALPKAPPPRPVQVAQPRLQPVLSRPYGRIVTCCWPIGEPGTKTFRFCDDRSEPGKPYCEDHAKLAYVKVRDRREDAA
ncbi:MAG: GcrA family cell cycle regulator [Rhodospirillales bacterium]